MNIILLPPGRYKIWDPVLFCIVIHLYEQYMDSIIFNNPDLAKGLDLAFLEPWNIVALKLKEQHHAICNDKEFWGGMFPSACEEDYNGTVKIGKQFLINWSGFISIGQSKILRGNSNILGLDYQVLHSDSEIILEFDNEKVIKIGPYEII